MDLKGKKVLLVGLGILGGGVATARWLLKQGASLTITDLKDENHLRPSLEKLDEFKNGIRWVIGEHVDDDFVENEIIVINPDVPINGNRFIEIARKAGKQIENELTLFYKYSPSKRIIAITGTRGKTTVTNWIGHFLSAYDQNTLIVGNNPEKPLLQEINRVAANAPIVIETPSFLLEIASESGFAPHIALITNIYRDHLNRHSTMEGYADAKANIFANQNSGDFLILNKEDGWTSYFIEKKPKSKILFVPDAAQEIFSEAELEEFESEWGGHNESNLLSAALAASTYGVPIEIIKKAAKTLPQMKFRQELIHKDGNLEIYNDSAATSPEATIAAAKRFGTEKEKFILITGGTNRDLEYKEWGKVMKGAVKPENLILLTGSATELMKSELDSYAGEYDALPDCLSKALQLAKNISGARIVFSPSSKSFEKFKNEFDRGEQFNRMVKEVFH